MDDFTGGTTGKPKGVLLSYDNVNWNAKNTIASWGLKEKYCTVNYMPQTLSSHASYPQGSGCYWLARWEMGGKSLQHLFH
ncbi:AMP-binding protein [Paenisporosarcina sp. NPDC076898]|uniref:AMP-binding protein n=1 Tax=unclassified Paenisporosarcina TaxID=2642018 RepID=UPI003CFE7FD7